VIVFRATNLSVVRFLLSAALGSFSGDGALAPEELNDFLKGDWRLNSPEAFRGGRLAIFKFSLLRLSEEASSTLSYLPLLAAAGGDLGLLKDDSGLSLEYFRVLLPLSGVN